MSDLRVLSAIANEMDVHLGLPDAAAARRELAELGAWKGTPTPTPVARPAETPAPRAGQAVLATWDQLLGRGRMQDGEPHLAGTARPAAARISAATAAEIGLADGQTLRVEGPAGAVRVPTVITEMPDRVVWLPTNAAGCAVRRDLGASTGTVVSLSADNGATVGAATSAGSEK